MWTKKLKRRIVKQYLAQFKRRGADECIPIPLLGIGGIGERDCENPGFAYINKSMPYGDQQMVVDVFPSITSIVEAGDKRFQEGYNLGRYREWALGRTDIKNWNDAKRAVVSDWPEGMQVLNDMLDELGHIQLHAPKSRRRKVHFRQDDGDEIDCDRLRGGQEFWRTSTRENTTASVPITIVAKMGGTRVVNPKDLFWCGVAAITLADILEQNGYMVKLVGCHINEEMYKNGDGNTGFLELKEVGMPMNKDAIAKAFSGWFHRTITFQSYCASRPEHILDAKGYPQMFTEETEMIKDYIGNDKAIVLCNIFSHSAAIEWLKDNLEQFA